MTTLSILRLAALVLVSFTSLGLLIFRDWRWSITTLAVQYAGIFVLVNAAWSVEMTAAKMVAGWMAGAILGIAVASTPDAWGKTERSWASERLLRIVAAVIVVISMLSLAGQALSWFSLRPVELTVLQGGFVLIGMGLLHLGLTSHPMRTIIALLTALSGFEVIYAIVENSVLVAGLLASVNLGLAVAGAYLLIVSAAETGE